MTHRGPFQPLLFCDSVVLSDGERRGIALIKQVDRTHHRVRNQGLEFALHTLLEHIGSLCRYFLYFDVHMSCRTGVAVDNQPCVISGGRSSCRSRSQSRFPAQRAAESSSNGSCPSSGCVTGDGSNQHRHYREKKSFSAEFCSLGCTAYKETFSPMARAPLKNTFHAAQLGASVRDQPDWLPALAAATSLTGLLPVCLPLSPPVNSQCPETEEIKLLANISRRPRSSELRTHAAADKLALPISSDSLWPRRQLVTAGCQRFLCNWKCLAVTDGFRQKRFSEALAVSREVFSLSPAGC